MFSDITCIHSKSPQLQNYKYIESFEHFYMRIYYPHVGGPNYPLS